MIFKYIYYIYIYIFKYVLSTGNTADLRGNAIGHPMAQRTIVFDKTQQMTG